MSISAAGSFRHSRPSFPRRSVGTRKKLLRDLTDELIPLYGASMQPLAELLKQWLDYLDIPTEQRDDYLSRLNPDLAATLKALGEFE